MCLCRPRLLATAGAWFLWDFSFYGNKVFQSTFISVLSPSGAGASFTTVLRYQRDPVLCHQLRIKNGSQHIWLLFAVCMQQLQGLFQYACLLWTDVVTMSSYNVSMHIAVTSSIQLLFCCRAWWCLAPLVFGLFGFICYISALWSHAVL